MEITNALNQINQIRAQSRNQMDNKLSFKQKTDNLIEGNGTKLSYEDVGAIINALPFPINPKWRDALGKHISGMTLQYFRQLVYKAIDARAPERYLMKCLTNLSNDKANRDTGGAPHRGSTSILTERAGGIR